MKTSNHRDENFLPLGSAQTTSLLRMAEKAFLQMGKWPSVRGGEKSPRCLRRQRGDGDASCRKSKLIGSRLAVFPRPWAKRLLHQYLLSVADEDALLRAIHGTALQVVEAFG